MPARINIIMNSRHERWKIGAGKYNAQKFQERLKVYSENPAICKCCQKSIEYKLRKNKFCGHSCSAKFTNKERSKNGFNTKGKIKQATCIVCNNNILVGIHACLAKAKCLVCKQQVKPVYKEKKCTHCNKIFINNTQRTTCSKQCEHTKKCLGAQNGGLKSASVQANIRRSKNEIYFAELCKKQFTNVITNKQYFNGWDADIILPDLRIAILWNGAWHYKQITNKHSVKQVQNRDKIKIKEIKNCGYYPYVIRDDGIKNTKFVEKQFDIFLQKVAEEGFEPSRPKGGAL